MHENKISKIGFYCGDTLSYSEKVRRDFKRKHGHKFQVNAVFRHTQTSWRTDRQVHREKVKTDVSVPVLEF